MFKKLAGLMFVAMFFVFLNGCVSDNLDKVPLTSDPKVEYQSFGNNYDNYEIKSYFCFSGVLRSGEPMYRETGIDLYVLVKNVKVKIDNRLPGTALSVDFGILESPRGLTAQAYQYHFSKKATVIIWVQTEEEKRVWERYLEKVIIYAEKLILIDREFMYRNKILPKFSQE